MSSPNVIVTLGPWRAAPTRFPGDESRYRTVGTVRVASPLEYYTIVQVERRHTGTVFEEHMNCGDDETCAHETCVGTVVDPSTYTSQILIGSLVNANDSKELFDKKTSLQGLWCSNCFADDIYGNGTGGVLIPHWMRGRYFSGMQGLPACSTCGAQPQVFDVEQGRVPGHAYLYRTTMDAELQKAVEAQLLLHGIATDKHIWSPGLAGEAEFKRELVELAFAPELMGRVHAGGGPQAVRDVMA